MRPFRDRPIRQKLLLLLMVTSSLALFLGSGVFVMVDLYSVRDSMVRRLNVLGNVLSSQCAGILRYREVATAPRETALLLRNLAAEPDIAAACVFDRSRRTVARYERAGSTNAPLPDVPDYGGPRFEGGFLEAYFPIEGTGTDRRSQLLGTLYLRFDIDEMHARMRFYLLVVAVTFLSAMGLAWVVSSRLESLISRPILDLAHTAGEVSRAGNYSLRAPKRGHDEVGQLVDGFNHMLEGIQERDTDLTRARSELEQRVEERTRALQLEVAERTRAEAELRQSQLAVMQNERLRAMGQMASGIAHDINNAISPVAGYSALLLRQEATLSPQSRRQLEHIGAAAESVAAIVARLREFYRRQPDDEQKTSIEVPKLLRHVAELTAPRWRSVAVERGCNLEVVVESPPSLPRILGLETELREVLTNLILNAVDALPQGGRIILRARPAGHIRAGEAPDSPSHVTIEVADNGQGMDEETRQRCFEAFYSTKGNRGTGLGLFMAHRIVEAHGGTIAVESAPSQGSTFRLMFPAHEPEATPTTAESAPAPATPTPARILFVDDEAMLRELVHEMLSLDGHTVETADGGEAALVAFSAAAQAGRPFDVVITDLGMPKMDGRQLARFLKEQAPTLPVIVMTGWGTLMKGEEDLGAPVDGLLSKPPSIPQLQAVLSRVLSRSKPA